MERKIYQTLLRSAQLLFLRRLESRRLFAEKRQPVCGSVVPPAPAVAQLDVGSADFMDWRRGGLHQVHRDEMEDDKDAVAKEDAESEAVRDISSG